MKHKITNGGPQQLHPNPFPVPVNDETTTINNNNALSTDCGSCRTLAYGGNPAPSSTFQQLLGRFHPSFDELRRPRFWHDVLVETVVCAYYEVLIIWIGVTANDKLYKPGVTHFGLFAGFCVFVLLEGYGPLSGASMNPARTWAFFLAGRMTFVRALIYTSCEIGGAAAGTMIGYGLTPNNLRSQLAPLLPGEGVTAPMGMAIEAIVTFNLIFVSLVVTDPLSKPTSVMPCFPIAFCVGTGIMAAGTHTGGLQNPLISFGPAICTGNFTDHWLYWAGPYAGSTVATSFYLLLRFVRQKFDKDSCISDDTAEQGQFQRQQLQQQQRRLQLAADEEQQANHVAILSTHI